MRFESTLAKRYITSQKRHSILLICSIIIAVGLMSMLFTSYHTFRCVIRAMHYDETPYHATVTNLTAGQCEKLKRRSEVGSLRMEELPGKKDKKRYDAFVLFDEYIGDTTYMPGIQYYGDYIEDLCKAIEIKPEQIELNDSLLTDDGLTLDAKYKLAQYFALFFIFVLGFAAALRLIIDTAFEVSSKERERQFGVLQSIGATPNQIVRIMTTEGLLLSAVGVPLGAGFGVFLGYIAYKAVLSSGIAEVFFTAKKAEELIHFHVSPLMILISAVTGFAWVMFSAYGTGMRVIRKSPVEVITARVNTVKKVKKHTFLGLVFGWTGKLASRNARRQKKRFIITVLSLTVSLTLFASLSSVIDSFSKAISDSLVVYDGIGVERYDFVLELNTGESYTDENGKEHYPVIQDAMGYLEPLKKLEDTGYFTNIGFYDYLHAWTGETKNTNTYIYYMNRSEYERLFDDEKTRPMSYDELAASGGGILVNTSEDMIPAGATEFETTVSASDLISKEEYEKLYDAKEKAQKEGTTSEYNGPHVSRIVKYIYMAHEDENKDDKKDDEEDKEYFYWKDSRKETTFRIIDRVTMPGKLGMPYDEGGEDYVDMDELNSQIHLIMTNEQWNQGDYELEGTAHFQKMINCNVKEDSMYSAAFRFLIANKAQYIPDFSFFEDESEAGSVFEQIWENSWNMYNMRKSIRTIFSAIRIGTAFIIFMLALIAIVNMVNIVSTGILNRKREFASMQCVGMTPGQLYGMTAVECLQFVLFAAVCSIVLCCVLIWLTKQMNYVMDLEAENAKKQVSYLVPIVKVLGATAFAYISALLTSLFPLHRMQKEPLVEQIRGVE